MKLSRTLIILLLSILFTGFSCDKNKDKDDNKDKEGKCKVVFYTDLVGQELEVYTASNFYELEESFAYDGRINIAYEDTPSCYDPGCVTVSWADTGRIYFLIKEVYPPQQSWEGDFFLDEGCTAFKISL